MGCLRRQGTPRAWGCFYGSLLHSFLPKDKDKAVYHHSVYLIYMQSTSCEMPGWINHKLESRLPGEISITSELKSLLIRVKEENEKAGLQLNIQKTKIKASGPITSW